MRITLETKSAAFICFEHIFADPGATYRDDPTADVFIQDDFGPEQNKHAAIPERLSLRKGSRFTF